MHAKAGAEVKFPQSNEEEGFAPIKMHHHIFIVFGKEKGRENASAIKCEFISPRVGDNKAPALTYLAFSQNAFP